MPFPDDEGGAALDADDAPAGAPPNEPKPAPMGGRACWPDPQKAACAFSFCMSWIDLAGVEDCCCLLAAEPSDIDQRSSKPPEDAGLVACVADVAEAPPNEPWRAGAFGVMIGEV